MHRWMRAAPLVAVLAYTTPSDSDGVTFLAVDPAVIQRRLEQVTRKLAGRQAALESLFHEVGCDAGRFTKERVPGSKAPNLVCTLAGQTDSEILVGGHFDSIEAGMGAVDDWSGVALLPSLYQSLASAPRKHRFVFVGFAAKETGLRGSREYVRRLGSREVRRIHAMINLECLGLGPPKVSARRADPHLLDAYALVAGVFHMETRGVNVDGPGDDDSHSFFNARVPVLTIHSLTHETLPILHNKRDTLAAIHADDYYTAYRLVAAYLAYLDNDLE
jgi:hypothetical protein